MAKKEKKKFKLWAEFKEFINKGNAFMLAVGVVIGAAFSAIVNSLVNILTSVATWPIPGGLKGLVTVLPAVTDVQKGVDGIGQFFKSSELAEMTIKYAASQGVTITTDAADAAAFATFQGQLKSLYTLHGDTFTYNMSAIIDWGTFINAVISFLIIAITLFIIVKVTTTLNAKRLALAERAKAKIEAKEAAKEAEEAETEEKAE